MTSWIGLASIVDMLSSFPHQEVTLSLRGQLSPSGPTVSLLYSLALPAISAGPSAQPVPVLRAGRVGGCIFELGQSF